MNRGVVVNFDLEKRFPRHTSQQRGSLCPRARRVAVLRVGARGGRPLPLRGSLVSPPEHLFEIFDAKSRVWGQFGPENKVIEGQPYEYDVICRNASVLAFHLWPTIFARAPFRLQNICRNGVPPRSRTTTPLPVNSEVDAVNSIAAGDLSVVNSRRRQRPEKICLSPEIGAGRQRVNMSIDSVTDQQR